jgi:hypothetical protein
MNMATTRTTTDATLTADEIVRPHRRRGPAPLSLAFITAVRSVRVTGSSARGRTTALTTAARS